MASDTADLLAAIASATSDAVFVKDLAGRYLYMNPACAALFGHEASALVGKRDDEIGTAADAAELVGRDAEVVASGNACTFEETIHFPEGTRVFSTMKAPYRLADGTIAGVVGVARDITASVAERLRTQEAARASQATLRSILETAPDVIIALDRDRRITFINRVMPQFRVEDVIGRDCFEFLSPDTREVARAAVDRVFATGKMELYDVKAPGVDGDDSWYQTRVGPMIQDSEVIGVTLCASDFSARMRAERELAASQEQFRQAHKMEAFGQLAGGVAHDFNNLLTVILGETDLLVAELPPDHSAIGPLSDIYEAGQRAASLTRQLLAFSRKTVLDPQVLDVNGVVRETEKMLRRLIGEDVTLVAKLAPSLRHVNVDPGQLSQVLVNLAVNSRDAMPGGGELRITTANAGPFVQISVRDSGTGMTDDVRARVFQPFFTTKGVGRGTGLGLAVVHGIVTQSGGRVEVTTAPGAGTTFDIFLPAVEDDDSLARSTRGPSSASGHETVLLVEDDAAIRRLATRTLVGKGYDVVEAADGAEAVRVLDQRPIDLVVTDVVMPVMDGGRLGEIVGGRFPESRVLYTSGYTDDMLVRRGIHADEVAFLAKPYSPAALVLAVRSTLDRPRPAARSAQG